MESVIDTPVFFLSAAEHSGDTLGASLIAALRDEFPAARFVGIGGRKMAAAGCRLLADPTANSAMLLVAPAQVGYWIKLLQSVQREFSCNRPSVVIPIDSPPVNIRVGKRARQLKIPVCYYVAPQLWAWAPWRIKKFAAAVNTVCCVLPFEEAYFRQQGVNAVYVGHPLFDSPADNPVFDPAGLKPPLPAAPVRVTLLPGSRQAEIDANLPPMLDAVRAIRARFTNSAFAAAAADDSRAWQIRACLRRLGESVDVRTGAADALIRWADLVLTCSGTATLQVARHHKPMIVMYALAWWKWNLVGRFLVQSRYLSLVNILADRELVPEFMPFYGSTQPLIRRAIDLLSYPGRMAEMSGQLQNLVAPLEQFSREMPAGRRVALQVAHLLRAAG